MEHNLFLWVRYYKYFPENIKIYCIFAKKSYITIILCIIICCIRNNM